MITINNPNTTERLIQEVRARPPLWDQRNLNYHNRIVVNALWQDIADSLKVNKETVKVKWKGLRDTYRRELKKQRSLAITNGGTDNAKDPSWTHYSSMNFLREYMGSNNNNHSDILQFPGWTTDDTVNEEISPTEEAFNSFVSSANIMDVIINSKEPIESGESSITDDEADQSEQVKSEPRSSPPPPPAPHPHPSSVIVDEKPHLSPSSSPVCNNNEVQDNDDTRTPKNPSKKAPCVSKANKRPAKEVRFRSKLRKKGTKVIHNGISSTTATVSSPKIHNGLTPQDDSDDDLYFFKSLIPYVKALPATRKLCLRSEIHNLVLREIMTECSSNHTVIPLEHVSVGLNA
ncbi:uncharacterized protein LOC135838890 [Planococcus citri]|uniref:uncharacterized protein LOC135838890 n=1 Tax=Planococcus citri TaxID=170843 RepID=UPI0031F83341